VSLFEFITLNLSYPTCNGEEPQKQQDDPTKIHNTIQTRFPPTDRTQKRHNSWIDVHLQEYGSFSDEPYGWWRALIEWVQTGCHHQSITLSHQIQGDILVDGEWHEKANGPLKFSDKHQVTPMTAVILRVLVAAFSQLWYWTAEDYHAFRTKLLF
jgi:hypothetical protein